MDVLERLEHRQNTAPVTAAITPRAAASCTFPCLCVAFHARLSFGDQAKRSLFLNSLLASLLNSVNRQASKAHPRRICEDHLESYGFTHRYVSDMGCLPKPVQSE
jgi:hypothetical protein